MSPRRGLRLASLGFAKNSFYAPRWFERGYPNNRGLVFQELPHAAEPQREKKSSERGRGKATIRLVESLKKRDTQSRGEGQWSLKRWDGQTLKTAQPPCWGVNERLSVVFEGKDYSVLEVRNGT